MATTPTYRVEARRAGKWWALSAPEIPGAHAQADGRDLSDVYDTASEMVALMLDVPTDTFLLDLVLCTD